MGKIENALYFVETWLHRISQLSIVLMMVGMNILPISRYIFRKPMSWTYDVVEMYLMVIVVFFSMSYLMAQKKHVNMDLIMNKLPPKWYKIVAGINYLLPFLLFLFISLESTKVVIESVVMGYVTSASIAVPLYTVLIIVPIGVIVLTVRLLFEFLRLFTSTEPERKG